jgi:hypothetical protein
VDADVPFTAAAASFIHYNQFTGGVWTRTAAANTRWVNYYLLAVPNTGTQGYAWVMGQTLHTSLAAAQAETVNNLAFGDMPFTEFAALYKLTFSAATANANTGKVQLVAASRIVGSSVSVSQTGINDHAALSNLAAAGAHPATSVSTDITNFNGLLSSADTLDNLPAAKTNVANTFTAEQSVKSLTVPSATTTAAIDFATEGLKTISIAAATTFTASNYANGRSVTIKVTCDATLRNLTFPTGWVFVGTKPASIAASKVGILTITSFGTTEDSCVAAWAVQA